MVHIFKDHWSDHIYQATTVKGKKNGTGSMQLFSYLVGGFLLLIL